MSVITRSVFFSAIKTALFTKFTQEQVDGLENILTHWEVTYPDQPLAFLANFLAQTYLETDTTMQPVKEFGGKTPASAKRYFFRMYDIQGSRPDVAKALGNIMPGDGEKYCGHGLLQITGRANMAAQSKKHGKDFLTHPEQLLDPATSVKVCFAAAMDGDFTGKSFSDYYNPLTGDFDAVNARRVINGINRAEEIGVLHQHFAHALQEASAEGEVSPKFYTEESLPMPAKARASFSGIKTDVRGYVKEGLKARATDLVTEHVTEKVIEAVAPNCKPRSQSKILNLVIGTAVTYAATALAGYGLNLPETVVDQIQVGLLSVSGTAIYVARRWFTDTVLR